VQECGKGLVDIKIDGERLLLALPEPEFREPTKSYLAAIADGLGVSAAKMARVVWALLVKGGVYRAPATGA
jgi:predicted PhzF superfamily epimerase YddE/YHI9